MTGRSWSWLGLLATALVCGGLPVGAAENACADCHEVSQQALAGSVHGFLSCADCHSGAQAFPHPEGVRQADCGVCHGEAVEEYAGSIHARVRANGGEAPTCVTCHGDIHTLISSSDPRAPVHPARLPDTCGSCHANPEMATRFGLLFTRPLEAYRASVHARALAEGRAGVTCNDCHTSHAILPAADPRSNVYPSRVPDTCGQCHQEIAATYARSIHGRAVAQGVHEAPVCTDCHGEHRILSPREPGSPVFPTNIPLQTCGRCHGDIRLSDKFGLPHDKVPAYEDSYHGLAARAGVQSVANCASCHGVHDILPSSDARSHVHTANLPQTCGHCHPGAGSRFSLGPVHVVATAAEFPAVYYIRLFYLLLIIVTIGAMVLHNLLDLLRKARSPALRTQAGGHTAPERMARGFRVAHGLVMVSFPLLVYTGFALTYPESWWAQPVVRWEASLGLRGGLHRAAAVVLVGALLFHLLHLVRSRRARACLAGMRPGREDWQELKQRLRYYLGRSREMPRSGKLGYVEKSEYLALLWGAAVMVLTGFLLWFESFTLSWFPKWVSDAATAIHFYEAILASLAILVWHFYWVIFDPTVYPMDMAWWSGRSPLGRAIERGEVEAAATPLQAWSTPEPPARAPTEETRKQEASK